MKLKEFFLLSMPKGKSEAEMTREIGVTHQMVCNWKTRNRIPSKHLFNVADFFEVNPRVLHSICQ